jgi:hypothetical protein
LRLLIAFEYWKRKGVRTAIPIDPEPKDMPPMRVWWGLLPLTRQYGRRKYLLADSIRTEAL